MSIFESWVERNGQEKRVIISVKSHFFCSISTVAYHSYFPQTRPLGGKGTEADRNGIGIG